MLHVFMMLCGLIIQPIRLMYLALNVFEASAHEKQIISWFEKKLYHT